MSTTELTTQERKQLVSWVNAHSKVRRCFPPSKTRSLIAEAATIIEPCGGNYIAALKNFASKPVSEWVERLRKEKIFNTQYIIIWTD